jgi:iron(III) transport system permease protein
VRWRGPVLVATTLVVAYLVGAPLVLLAVSSVKSTKDLLPFENSPWTLANYAQVFGSVETYQLLGNTFVFAAGAIAVGFSFALAFAWLVDRTDLPLRNLVFTLLLVPMAIPGLLAAIGWILLLGPGAGLVNVALRGVLGLPAGTQGPLDVFSLWGMIGVEGLRMVPTMFLMFTAALRVMDPALEEQARVSGAAPARMVRCITLPLLLPALLAALMYFAIASIESFEVPGVLGFTAGVRVFSTQIFWATHPDPGLPDYGLASTLSSILVALALVMMWIYFRVTRRAERFVTVTGRGYRPKRVALGAWRTPALAMVALYLGISVVLPFGVLVWSSLLPFFQPPGPDAFATVSLAAYARVAAYPGIARVIVNTLVVSVSAATVAVALVTLTSWMTVRARLRGARALDVLTFVPLAIPGIVVGLATMLVFLSFPNPIYGTVWIIVVAATTKFLAFAGRSVGAAQLQLHPELEEASHVSGARWALTMRRILVPLLAPSLLNAWLWVFIHAMRELSIPLMLATPDNLVLSTLIWRFWDNGQVRETSVLAVVLVLVLGTVTFASRVTLERRSGVPIGQ